VCQIEAYHLFGGTSFSWSSFRVAAQCPPHLPKFWYSTHCDSNAPQGPTHTSQPNHSHRCSLRSILRWVQNNALTLLQIQYPHFFQLTSGSLHLSLETVPTLCTHSSLCFSLASGTSSRFNF